MRIRLQQYRISKSAKALAQYLNVKRLKLTNSRFRPRYSDIIINWGNCPTLPNATYLNNPTAVSTACNKLQTFTQLQSGGVSVPAFYTSLSELDPDTKYLARTTLYGHSGEGIIAGTQSELPHAPLYTQFIPKVAEFRAIVVNNQVVDFKQKLRKRDFDGDRAEEVWNCDNGYVFCRNNVVMADSIRDLAIQASKTLGLTYVAWDIIEDLEGTYYILEANTAFGIEGSTTAIVGDAIRQYINQIN